MTLVSSSSHPRTFFMWLFDWAPIPIDSIQTPGSREVFNYGMGLLIDGKFDRLFVWLPKVFGQILQKISDNHQQGPKKWWTEKNHLAQKMLGFQLQKAPQPPEPPGNFELPRCDISSNIAHAMMRWPWVVTSYGAYRRCKWLNHRLWWSEQCSKPLLVGDYGGIIVPYIYMYIHIYYIYMYIYICIYIYVYIYILILGIPIIQ